jgi:hypothetical protein
MGFPSESVAYRKEVWIPFSFQKRLYIGESSGSSIETHGSGSTFEEGVDKLAVWDIGLGSGSGESFTGFP